MADFTSNLITHTYVDGYLTNQNQTNTPFSSNNYLIDDVLLFIPVIRDFDIQTVFNYYLMRGKDIDCVGPNPTYRVWVVEGSPDTTGSLYLGVKCGLSPLQDIVVDAYWQYLVPEV